MKSITLLLVALLLAGISFGQKAKKEVVYLKNGSVVKGRLVEVDDEKMLIQSARNSWVFNRSEIDTVAMKPFGPERPDQSMTWYLKCSAGVLVGSSDNEKDLPFSADLSANFRIVGNLYAGVGAGVDFLEESYLPAFGNLEYHFRKSQFTPFVGMKAGYLFPLDGDVNKQGGIYYAYPSYYDYYYPYYMQTLDNKGGIMLNPSIGCVCFVSEHLGFSLAFGYRYSQVTFKGEDHYELETNYNRLSIKLGILFN